jgi:uracil-DNA glycosylase
MSWQELIEREAQGSYFQDLQQFLLKERQQYLVHPDENQVFRAFELTPLDEVRVVILGQDPYPSPGHAHGLAFSVASHVRPLPKSLQNIFKEISSNYGVPIPENGNLEHWAKQGVLLLNTVLTVRSGAPKSHANKGWDLFTDAVIRTLNEQDQKIVFVLWGNDAQTKVKLLTNPNHLVLSGVHPSPLSAYRGFFGCQHFIKVNMWLEKNAIKPIQWSLKIDI